MPELTQAVKSGPEIGCPASADWAAQRSSPRAWVPALETNTSVCVSGAAARFGALRLTTMACIGCSSVCSPRSSPGPVTPIWPGRK